MHCSAATAPLVATLALLCCSSHVSASYVASATALIGEEDPCAEGSLNGTSCTITNATALAAAFACAPGNVDELPATYCKYRGSGGLVIQGPLVFSWGPAEYVQLLWDTEHALEVRDANLSAAGFLVRAASVFVGNTTPAGVAVLNTSATGCGSAASGSPRAPSDGATHGGVGGLGDGTCFNKAHYAPPANSDAVGNTLTPWSPLSSACGAGVQGGGAGGGIINITATGSIVLHGWLLANGGNATLLGQGGSAIAGAGAGGTIVVASSGGGLSLNQTVRISANGGAAWAIASSEPTSNAPQKPSGGSGGGGRIYIESVAPVLTVGTPFSATAGPIGGPGAAAATVGCLCGGAGTIAVCTGGVRSGTCIVEVSNENVCAIGDGLYIGPTKMDLTPETAAPRVVASVSVQKQAVLATVALNVSAAPNPSISVSSGAVLTTNVPGMTPHQSGQVQAPAMPVNGLASDAPKPGADPELDGKLISLDVGTNGTISMDDSTVFMPHGIAAARLVLSVHGGTVSLTSQTDIATDVVLITAGVLTVGSDSSVTAPRAGSAVSIGFSTCAMIKSFRVSVFGELFHDSTVNPFDENLMSLYCGGSANSSSSFLLLNASTAFANGMEVHHIPPEASVQSELRATVPNITIASTGSLTGDDLVLSSEGALVIAGQVSARFSPSQDLCPSNLGEGASIGSALVAALTAVSNVSDFTHKLCAGNNTFMNGFSAPEFKVKLFSQTGFLSSSLGVTAPSILWCNEEHLNVSSSGVLSAAQSCCAAGTGFGAGGDDSSAGGGGGHGGAGGDGFNAGSGGGIGGHSYGDSQVPRECGSGGGSGGGSSDNGGRGGGYIVLASMGVLHLDGVVSADGGTPTSDGGGGGSGGSVIIVAPFLRGASSGSVSANGGSGSSSAFVPSGQAPATGGGGGGGGRVRLSILSESPEQVAKNFSGRITAAGGIASGKNFNGHNGTVTGVDCSPGNSGSLCTPCSPGYFKPNRGSSPCLPCPVGHHAKGEGQVACNECEPGRFQNSSGQANCTACAIGQYQDTRNATSCQLCAWKPSKSDFYQSAEKVANCSYRCHPFYAGDDCRPCLAWELGGYNPCSFDPTYASAYPYGANCSANCAKADRDESGRCTHNISDYVCGGVTGKLPNGHCIGDGKDPRSFIPRHPSAPKLPVSCKNVSSATALGTCGTCACVSAGFVAPFCVSELDMIIHTFGGRLGWFLMAILGLIFVIGLAIVGICQCARAQRKKHAAHRALLQSGAGRPARPSFSTTHARVRGDTDSEYHSLSSPHANLRQPLLNAASSPGMASNGDLNRRAASSAADVVGGVPKAVNNNTIENHLVRIYFEGRNSFSDPLYLPVYPPPELALLIDHSAYQDFVTDLNSESQFTRCQKAMYYFWCIIFYPVAVVYLQRLRLNIVRALQENIAKYNHDFFTHCRVKVWQESLRGFHSLDCSVFFIEVYHTDEAGERTLQQKTFVQPPRPAQVGPKTRTVVKLAGDGSYFFPYFVDPNDVLVKAVHCMPGLQKLMSKEWPAVVQALNNSLRVLDRADLNRTLSLAIRELRHNPRLKELEGLDINLVLLRPTSFDALAVPDVDGPPGPEFSHSHSADYETLDLSGSTRSGRPQRMMVVDALEYRKNLGLSTSSLDKVDPGGLHKRQYHGASYRDVSQHYSDSESDVDAEFDTSGSPASFRRAGRMPDSRSRRAGLGRYAGGGLDAHGYVRSESLGNSSLRRQASGSRLARKGSLTRAQIIGDRPSSPRGRKSGESKDNIDDLLQDVLGSSASSFRGGSIGGRRVIADQGGSSTGADVGFRGRSSIDAAMPPSSLGSMVEPATGSRSVGRLICRRYDVMYLTHSPTSLAIARAEMQHNANRRFSFGFTSGSLSSLGSKTVRENQELNDINVLLHRHEPHTCSFNIVPGPVELNDDNAQNSDGGEKFSSATMEAIQLEPGDSLALVFSRGAAIHSREHSVQGEHSMFTSTGAAAADSPAQAREALRKLRNRQRAVHKVPGLDEARFDTVEDDDEDDDFDHVGKGFHRGHSPHIRRANAIATNAGGPTQRYSSIREESVGDDHSGNMSQKGRRDAPAVGSRHSQRASGTVSLLGPDSALDASPELREHEKQRRIRASRRLGAALDSLDQGSEDSDEEAGKGAGDDYDNYSGRRRVDRRAIGNKSLLGSALRLGGPTDLDFDAAEHGYGSRGRSPEEEFLFAGPSVGSAGEPAHSGHVVAQECAHKQGIVCAVNVSLEQARDCGLCLSRLRRVLLRNTQGPREPSTPGCRILQRVTVVFLCVLDMVESVVNASYLISPASTNGWQISGAFYFFILVWPFMVVVDPFFTFFVVVYGKPRDARYASSVTMYSCINIIVAAAVLLIPLAFENKGKVIQSIFSVDGSWPFFILFPGLNIVQKILRLWLTQRCVAQFESGDSHHGKSLGWNSIAYTGTADGSGMWY